MLSKEMIEVFHSAYDDFDTPEGADMRRLLAHVHEQEELLAYFYNNIQLAIAAMNNTVGDVTLRERDLRKRIGDWASAMRQLLSSKKEA